jgi:UDP-2,3-diacylglucosamine hydrolase
VKLDKVFFISDVHLGHGTKESERAKEIELLRFFDMVGQSSGKLFIVGDFFDVWFEYKLAVPKGFVRVLGKLAELVDSGVEVYYVLGNHDFWVRNYFEDEIGIKVFKDDLKVELNGKKFYIIHGDGLSKDDIGYRVLKKIFRNGTSIFLYSLLHPDLGLKLASAFSRKSREYSTNRASVSENRLREEKSMVEFAQGKIEDGFDYVVMGHLHKPGMKKLGDGYYVNIGDWLWNFTYGFFETEFVIKKWEFTSDEVKKLLQK